MQVQLLSSAPEIMGEDKLFFVGQKAFIYREGKILVMHDKDGLDFPGGKIQEGETDFEASIKREVEEETGLEIIVGEPFTVWYRIGTKGIHEGKTIFLVGYRCRLVDGEVRISDEHDSFEWVGKEDYRKLDDGSLYFKALEKYFEGA